MLLPHVDDFNAGKRAILDGGFTRLYYKWDTAGTGRYVKNAASWLVNAEKFGDAVINPAVKAKSFAKPPVVNNVVTIARAPVASSPSPWITSGMIGLILACVTLLLLVASIAPTKRD